MATAGRVVHVIAAQKVVFILGQMEGCTRAQEVAFIPDREEACIVGRAEACIPDREEDYTPDREGDYILAPVGGSIPGHLRTILKPIGVLGALALPELWMTTG